MKLICLNVGIKIDNSEKVGQFLKEQQPDIVALQEVVRHFDDAVFDMYKSKAGIEKFIGKDLPYSFFGPQWICDAMRKKGKMHRDFNGFVEQGNQVLSKFPITSATNEHYHKKYSLELEWIDFHTEDHPRSVQIVELDIKSKPLQILNLHGLYSRDKQDSPRTIKQSQYLIEAANRKNVATMIVGDLNLYPDTKSIAMINKKLKNLIQEYKIISTLPDFDHGTESCKEGILDYIFINDQIKVNDFKVFETNISDHLPLVLDFDIK